MNDRITIDWRKDRYALDQLMRVDHVIRVHKDGTVSEPMSVWAPEVYDNAPEGEPEDIMASSPAGGPRWSLLSGWSAEYMNRGPVMGDSEYVGGALARHILENPGLYTIVTVTDPNGDDIGWAVAFAECE